MLTTHRCMCVCVRLNRTTISEVWQNVRLRKRNYNVFNHKITHNKCTTSEKSANNTFDIFAQFPLFTFPLVVLLVLLLLYIAFTFTSSFVSLTKSFAPNPRNASNSMDYKMSRVLFYLINQYCLLSFGGARRTIAHLTRTTPKLRYSIWRLFVIYIQSTRWSDEIVIVFVFVFNRYVVRYVYIQWNHKL